MTSVFQPILEKGILDHSIVHRALLEYLAIADKVLLLIVEEYCLVFELYYQSNLIEVL